jgi:hypothetical protein
MLAAVVLLTAGPASIARAQAPDSKWQPAINATWGPGAPTERKLAIFDAFSKTIDERFAAFQGLDVDWAALRDRYRPEIAAGVSEGRFAGIMTHLALALREQHTIAGDLPVLLTPRRRGVPIMVIRGEPINNTFGACATAQDDGSALIYSVAPGHPLGLQPGDRILGYDGRLWPELYQELLAAELPTRGTWGSSASTWTHMLVQSANVNWHLFGTIDIWKHDSGTVEHFPTALLNTTPVLRGPLCSEQLPVPGVPKPAALSDLVTWGIVAGTRIGYIYVTAWEGDAGDRFAQAIEELTQQRDAEGRIAASDGLIIDFRFNRGGNMFLSDAGLGMLFDRPTPTIAFAERADPSDHYKMRPAVGEPGEICGVHRPGALPSLYVIDMCDHTYDPRSYERPIAVLTGPSAVSSGDQVALRMTYHPRARIFGKSTNTSFNAPCQLSVDPGWLMQYACADAYRINNPHDYLTHDDLPVDEPVWLRPDDVAQGKDTVVDAALRWINGQTP